MTIEVCHHKTQTTRQKGHRCCRTRTLPGTPCTRNLSVRGSNTGSQREWVIGVPSWDRSSSGRQAGLVFGRLVRTVEVYALLLARRSGDGWHAHCPQCAASL